jgi:hypothetical protein
MEWASVATLCSWPHPATAGSGWGHGAVGTKKIAIVFNDGNPKIEIIKLI